MDPVKEYPSRELFDKVRLIKIRVKYECKVGGNFYGKTGDTKTFHFSYPQRMIWDDDFFQSYAPGGWEIVEKSFILTDNWGREVNE